MATHTLRRPPSAWIASITIGTLFIVAALAKAHDPVPFAAVILHVLRSVGLENLSAISIAVLLVLLEALLGLVFLFRLDGPRWRLGTAVLLASFCAILGWMYFHPSANGCGCIGFFANRAEPRLEVVTGLLRNVGLGLCLFALGAKATASSPTRPATTSNRPVRAFTILELLVVILIIGILTTLAAPHLRRSRERATMLRELAQCRDVYMALSAFGHTQRDQFPYMATPGDPAGPLTVHGFTFNSPYFTGQAKYFINLLYPDGIPHLAEISGDPPHTSHWPTFPPELVRSRIQLSYTAFSRPAYWIGTNPPSNKSLLSPGLWSDIAFPSSKGLLVDFRAWDRLSSSTRRPYVAPWQIAWADGAASSRQVDCNQQFNTLARPSATFAWPVLATEGGLSGRDFEPPSPSTTHQLPKP